MKKLVVLDPFNEKYACCLAWRGKAVVDEGEVAHKLLEEIFSQIACPTCGRVWDREDDGRLVLRHDGNDKEGFWSHEHK